MTRVPQHYVPKHLSRKAKKRQKKELAKSRRAYKKGKYHTRKKIKGYKSKRSRHENRVRKIYKFKNNEKITIRKLSKKTHCSEKSLKGIVKKGQGAYYSSGSRPNQTAHSWGYARLYSAITGGPAAKYDKHLLDDGCSKKSKALKLAKNPRKNTRRKKVQIGGEGPKRPVTAPILPTGISKEHIQKVFDHLHKQAHSQGQNGGYKMKEKIIRFEKSPIHGKKYRAFVRDYKTKKERHIDFGASDYQQYKDRVPLKVYAHKNHGTRKRMRNYFNRHSGTPIRSKAIEKERKKSRGYYNAKILSHEYLW